MNRRLIFGLAAVLAIGACNDQQDPSDPSDAPAAALSKASSSYVIGFSSEARDVRAAIERAGGKALYVSRRAGLGTAESADPGFAKKLKAERGIRVVALDTVVQWAPPERIVEASIGDNETVFNAQWAPQSIHAEEAWDAGAHGKGARVAVLDGGLNNTHNDLNSSVDVANSRSFVSGQLFNQDVRCTPTPPATTCVTFSHATHVAGIIAAEDDDNGAIGIAPGATIIGVKVLHGGSGSFGAIISAIVYAASPDNPEAEEDGAGAHIINMSLGAQFPSGRDGKVRALKALMDEATTFAHEQGVLVVAAAGNGDKKGRGIDHDLGQWFTLPAQAKHVVGVSALAPVGFAVNPPLPTSDDFDRLASYSNLGVRIVDLSGPGGDGALPNDFNGDGVNDNCTLPLNPSGSITRSCRTFDFVISPGSLVDQAGAPVNDVNFFAAGTSMSAPAVSGVAALVIGTKGHLADEPPMRAEALFNHLANTADKGLTGGERVHGQGRVNALRATR